MDFSAGVHEAKQATRYDCDWVEFIVYPREIRDLRVKECRPRFISNARLPIRNTSDGRALRQIKLQEQRIEFRKSSAK